MKELTPNIIIDPAVRFGKPVIRGTRITVEEVLGALAGGMDFVEIEREYGITKKDAIAAIGYAFAFMRGEEVKIPEPMAV